jgi:hypothetical protein
MDSMEWLKISGVSSLIGASVGGVFILVGMFVNSWLTKGRERRQQVWQAEIKRIIDLEERAGQLVELIGSYNDPVMIKDKTLDDLGRLEVDAGRFRRHRKLMQAIRDLHNGLNRLSREKIEQKESRGVSAEVNGLFDKLLLECDKVTGKRIT